MHHDTKSKKKPSDSELYALDAKMWRQTMPAVCRVCRRVRVNANWTFNILSIFGFVEKQELD